MNPEDSLVDELVDEVDDAALPSPDEVTRALRLARFPMDELVAAVQSGRPRVHLRGAKGALAAMVLSELRRRTGRALVIIGPEGRKLHAISEDLRLFAPAGERAPKLIPAVDISPYSGLSPNRMRIAERLTACFEIIIGESAPYTFLSVRSALRRCPPAEVIEALSEVIAVGSEIDLSRFRRLLVDCGYSPVQLVEDPGTFAIRGGLLDVFSPSLPYPVRVELFGDEVETLRTFDPVSQKTIEHLEGFYVSPVREEVFTDNSLATARRRIRELADRQDLPSKALRKVLADLGHGMHFLGIEALLPAFYDRLDTVVSLFPDSSLLVVMEPDLCLQEAEAHFDLLTEQYQRSHEHGELVFEPGELFMRANELERWFESRQHLYANSLLGEESGPIASAGTRDGSLRASSVPGSERLPIEFGALDNQDLLRARNERGSGEGAIKALVGMLPAWREVYGEIVLACRTSGNAERLTSLLKAHGQKTVLDDDGHVRLDSPHGPPATVLRVVQRPLSAGLRLPAMGLALVSEEELFGPRARRSSARTKEKAAGAIASFKELKPGDHLVHVQHGIGRYDGLVKFELGGLTTDFLCLVYAGEDKLYVPVHRLDSVQKHSDEGAGRVDKLGSTQWEKTKSKVKADIKKLAIDLLALYARRQSRPGFAFGSRDDQYFQEFEASFPFEETVDQAAAIEEVLEDMMKPRPMDRLICGDVGFGKTEVAIRAAFKAVIDGKQAAILVPTTILAEQHLNSFRTRFSGYPVVIEALSRFRSPKESQTIIDKLALGQIDIVIGTHRLLSKDLEFRDLGVLIVDEEHRFGVGHKEKIKQMSATVDVLTMTATPIPRTLQMSLVGIRDLSVISTPPQDRLAVRTYVAKFGQGLIREAIVNELTRGGQVYFLHNRVETIEQMSSTIRELVPEATIGVAHGQMDERQLEKVMLQFIRGELNVLVCTTIIESGLDIPNANCLIVNRADMLGLAQLYQLRGRVGRSNQRAHCYLLIPGDETITAEARERLDAIQRFTDLGSGLEIAQADLELRGAGNLLGPEQSGNIGAVGLEMYAELLEEAIQELRGEEVVTSVEPEVNLPVEAYLPEEYLPDVQLRLLFYKQLSMAPTMERLFELYGELKDRFGAPPKEVENLRRVIEVKLLVKRLGAAGVDANSTAIIVNIGERSRFDPSKVVAYVTAQPKRLSLRTDMRLVKYLKKAESADLIETTKMFLHELAEHTLM